MTERIDHAAEAQRILSLANSQPDTASAGVTTKAAQVHATLALVEQQREANEIAQKDAERERVTTLLDIVSFGTDELVAAVRPHVFWDNDEQGESLRPEVAAALGITEETDDE